MDQADVQAAIATLEAQGKAPSLSNLRKELGHGSWRDIVRWKRALLDGAPQAEAALPDDAQETPTGPDPVDLQPVPDAGILPAPVSRLERLQEAVRTADATLIRLTRQRDLQQQEAQWAALALHQAKREAQRLAVAVRQAARMAQHTPPRLQAEAWPRVQQLEAQLADIVGQAAAARIVADPGYTPDWLRAR